ncbi:MAG: hypothetical protein GC149_11205 [Gammaproteobacteria bacterium]|nr:hypothetical protein [Gammaproteobacteria bacterium]
MTDTTEQFDARPRAVRHWLDALPIAHHGETSRQLYTALCSVNQQEDVPAKHRFHFLEGVAEPLNMLLPELHKHYAGKPLPLSKKRRKVADLYTQLLRQSILGYQQVIARAIELNRFGWKKVVTASIHRIFYYSSLMLLNQRLMYQPYQKGMWLQLYWLYQMAENYKLLKVKIPCAVPQHNKTTIAAEFNKLLLQSLLAPNLFRPEELEDVLASMDIWVEELTVTRTRLDEPQDQIYAFTLDADLPPGLMASDINRNENPEIDVRYFNITPVLNFLNTLLSQAKPGVDQILIARHHTISRRNLILLLNNWGRPASRDGERRLIQGQAEVAIGISAIHYIISEGRQPSLREPAGHVLVNAPDSVIAIQQDSPKSDNSLAALGFTTDREVQADVWESAYFEPEPTPQAWTESVRMKVYSYLNAKVINISKGGFCIALPQSGVDHIQTSELVAIRGKRGEWQLGEIRWLLCPNNASIRAGIQRHSQQISPALLHVQSKNNPAQPIKCLVGQNELGSIVFLPNIPFSLENKLTLLEINGELQRFNLSEQLYSTPAGSAFYFEWHAALKTPTKSIPDSYESIWAKL